MSRVKFLPVISLLLVGFSLAGCCRSPGDVWDDTKTAGRHMGRGLRSLGGKHGDSRQIRCREDFLRCEDDYCIQDFQAMEFESLPDQDYSGEIAMANTKRTHSEPGSPMSNIPGIEAFTNPSNDPALARIFQKVHFPYNSSLVKGKQNLDTIRVIAEYMKKYPNTYLFVEGHCDERGAEAYNLALGARRSNTVRNVLIKEGASPEKIFTVSYGKERPFDPAHTEDAWAKNRRAEFKIYQQ
ncbi:MAG: OmpA family protein [Waddliaceae bacterium]